MPIPGKPLQARYYGPYTVDKKYIDMDIPVISSVNLVNSVPPEQNQMDSEELNFVNSDPLSLKLKNLVILKDLDKKLSHLSSDKRLEMN